MKRVVFLVTVLGILAFCIPPEASASPIACNRIDRLAAFVSHHFADIMSRFHAETVLIDDGRNDAMVGGDADDYANGRFDPDGPTPDDTKKSMLGAGFIRPGGSGSRTGSMKY